MSWKKTRRNNCTWTEEEDQFVLDHAGSATYDYIGRQIGRTPRAVQNRLRHLDTEDKRILTGMMHAADLARLIHIDKSHVIRLIREEGLPATQPNLRYQNDGATTRRWMIDPVKFWKWAEKNRHRLNFHLIERNSIVPEPNWVEQQRRIDFHKPVTRRRWTDEEKEKALTLLNRGHSRPEVARALNRSVSSIRWILDKHLEEIGVK